MDLSGLSCPLLGVPQLQSRSSCQEAGETLSDSCRRGPSGWSALPVTRRPEPPATSPHELSTSQGHRDTWHGSGAPSTPAQQVSGPGQAQHSDSGNPWPWLTLLASGFSVPQGCCRGLPSPVTSGLPCDVCSVCTHTCRGTCAHTHPASPRKASWHVMCPMGSTLGLAASCHRGRPVTSAAGLSTCLQLRFANQHGDSFSL